MNKQIEEVSVAICKSRGAYNGYNCRKCGMHERCLYQDIAVAVYKAGYRKQSEGEWIFEHEFYGNMLCSNCKEKALVNECNEYVDSNFCPNCGAKMKGGE